MSPPGTDSQARRCLAMATLITFAGTLGMPAAGIADPVAPALAPGCFADCADGLSAQNDRGPAVGAVAPTFEAWLVNVDGPSELRSLSDLLDGRPLILAFGSYT